MARIVQRQRRTNVAKPVYISEATESANAVGQVLAAHYGEQAWILQIMEMVQASVDRGVKQLAGTPGPTDNAQAFTQVDQNQYAMPARTAPEVHQAPAAHQGHIPAVQPQQVPQQ